MAEQEREQSGTFGESDTGTDFGSQPGYGGESQISGQGVGSTEGRSSFEGQSSFGGESGGYSGREGYGRGEGRRATRHLKEQASVLRDDVRDLAYAAGDAAREQLDPLEEYVREQPMKAMLIAVGVGALLGMVFLRR